MDLTSEAKKLQESCNSAYDSHQTSCSHSVWAVIKDLVNEKEPYREANDLVDYLDSHWTEINLDVGFDLANKGKVVVGGTKEIGGHGHVVVIYPGDKKGNGGYLYYYAKAKKNIMLRTTGFYPRVMSTSMGSWPGARSRGDKTVWDPWGSDDAFKAVCFWTPKS